MNFNIEKVIVKLPSGANIGSKTVALPHGLLLGVQVYKQTNTTSDLFLECGIKDDSGVAVNKSVNIDFFKKREGGSFHQSYVPLNTQTRGLTHIFEVNVADGSTPPTTDVYVQFVLIYGSENLCLKQ